MYIRGGVRIQIIIAKVAGNLEQQKKLTSIDKDGRIWDYLRIILIKWN
jgi:hypothetical protein